MTEKHQIDIPGDRVSQLEDSMKVIVSVNPKAGARSSRAIVESLRCQLNDSGYSVDILSDIQEVQSKVIEYKATGDLRAVVAAGGDGTASLIVEKTPPGTPIAILPQGTENLLAKYLGIPADPDFLCELIQQGTVIDLDAGKADDRLFLLMLGCGFDAEVVRRLDENRTGHIHHLSYAKPIFDSIMSYQYPDIQIECSDEKGHENSLNAKWAFIVNLPRYAAGLKIAPSANGTDEMLDLCAFREGSFLSGLTYLTGILFGKHENWEDCLVKKSRQFVLKSNDRVPYQLDGDPGGFLPVTIEVLPKRFRVFVSRAHLKQTASVAYSELN